MENSNVNNLIEEGKKHIAALEVELNKLANTAEQVLGVKAEEVTKQADELIRQTKTQIETKAQEIKDSEDFKNLETEGKKALADIESKLNDLSADLNSKFKNLFGSK